MSSMAVPHTPGASEKDAGGSSPADLDPLDDDQLESLVRHKLPIILPWHKGKVVRLGTCLHSSMLKTSDPWEEGDNPFSLAYHDQICPILTRENGTTASFKSTSTSRQSDTKDHLSLGFGVGVSLPFLASASVKSQYEKEVKKNEDVNKNSIHANIRAGSVEFSRHPRLSDKAANIIQSNGGISALENVYGDYYISEYRLGGDMAMLLSSSSSSSIENKTFGVTASLNALPLESSKHWEKEVDVFESSSTLKLLGYDTLAGINWDESSTGGRECSDRLFSMSQEIASNAECLGERLSGILDNMDLENGDELTVEQCDELGRRGVVVELILMPLRTVRQVMEYMVRDGVL